MLWIPVTAGVKSIPGSTTNLREGELDAPDFTLITQTILADEFQFGVPGS
jgi:hypothetical protein